MGSGNIGLMVMKQCIVDKLQHSWNEESAKYFSIYRAHPLFLQFIVRYVCQFGVSDTIARIARHIRDTYVILVYIIGKDFITKGLPWLPR